MQNPEINARVLEYADLNRAKRDLNQLRSDLPSRVYTSPDIFAAINMIRDRITAEQDTLDAMVGNDEFAD